MLRFVCCIAILIVLVPPAWAQSGSAGGSIGKQNKSASGAVEGAVPAKPASPSGPRAAAATDEQKLGKRGGGHCGRIAGTWTANGWWNSLYGRGDVVLNADGSARHTSGIAGTWTCNGTAFVMDWKNWAYGEGTLSADGNTIKFSDGGTMTRGR